MDAGECRPDIAYCDRPAGPSTVPVTLRKRPSASRMRARATYEEPRRLTLMVPYEPITVRGRPPFTTHRPRDAARRPTPCVAPTRDLGLARPQLCADAESAGSTAFAPQVVDRLDGNLQLGGKLGQRDVVPGCRLSRCSDARAILAPMARVRAAVADVIGVCTMPAVLVLN